MLSDEGLALFTKWRVGAFGLKLREVCEDESYDDTTFEEKIELCVGAEIEARDGRKIEKAVRSAKFKIKDACVEDIYHLPDRSITRDRIARLASCAWVEARENLVVISESGGGKSYVAQAIGVSACRRLMFVRYARLNDMFREINVARSEGSVYDALDRFSKPVPAHPRRLLHDADREPAQRRGPVRDAGGQGGPRLHADRVAAGARPVVPEDQLGPVRRLDPEQGRRARQVPGYQGSEHAGVHSEAEGRKGRGVLGVTAVPDARNAGTASS